MKNSMFLSDFLLLKDCCNDGLLETCIGLYDELRRNECLENQLKYDEAFEQMCEVFEYENKGGYIHFEDEDHFYTSLHNVVCMTWDAFNTKTRYIITPLHKIPSSVKL